MVKNDFAELGLNDYGVIIQIDELSKTNIIEYIDSENFNQLKYIKQDYNNFKEFLKTPSYPKHMDYINSDYAPNLLKFMKIKIDSKKTNSYYGFLKGIGESVPAFSEDQIATINYLSGLLPLVRRHEFLIVKHLIAGVTSKDQLYLLLNTEISGCTNEQIDHAMRFMCEGKAISVSDNVVSLCGANEPEFTDFINDMLDYGLVQYSARYKDEDVFLLYQDYRQDQALMKILENPKHNQLGTYYKDGNMYIFAGLKKDANVNEHLNYKDKFLSNDVFQWESVANIDAKEEAKQASSKQAFIFVRKVKEENGITLPYTFVGVGHLDNPRKNESSNGSILYDIHLDTPLPNDLYQDFMWIA